MSLARNVIGGTRVCFCPPFPPSIPPSFSPPSLPPSLHPSLLFSLLYLPIFFLPHAPSQAPFSLFSASRLVSPIPSCFLLYITLFSWISSLRITLSDSHILNTKRRRIKRFIATVVNLENNQEEEGHVQESKLRRKCWNVVGIRKGEIEEKDEGVGV